MKKIPAINKYSFLYNDKYFNFYTGPMPTFNNQYDYIKYFRENKINNMINLCENVNYDEELFEINNIKIIPLIFSNNLPTKNILYYLDILFNKWHNNDVINVYFYGTSNTTYGYKKPLLIIGYLVCKHMKHNVKYYINMIKLDHFDVLSTEQYKWLKQCSDNKNNCCLIV
jgi:hypothetical protein